MGYVLLGARPLIGVIDNTGRNKGNWTIAFTPDIINVNMSQFEVYHIVVAGAPNTTFTVYVDAFQWDNASYGTLNSWDPNEALILRPGQTLYFFYSDAASDNTPPTATIWLRYDSTIAQPERGLSWDGKQRLYRYSSQVILL